MTTVSRLEEIAARVAAATPGPWKPFADTKNKLWNRVGCVAAKDGRLPIAGGTNGGDAAFIAAARDDVPFLLAVVERLQAPHGEHKPGDPHQYRLTCEVCGDRGTIRLTVDPETAGIKP